MHYFTLSAKTGLTRTLPAVEMGTVQATAVRLGDLEPRIRQRAHFAILLVRQHDSLLEGGGAQQTINVHEGWVLRYGSGGGSGGAGAATEPCGQCRIPHVCNLRSCFPTSPRCLVLSDLVLSYPILSYLVSPLLFHFTE